MVRNRVWRGDRVRRGVCKLVDPRATEIALTFQLGPGILNLLFFFFFLKKAIKTYNSNSQKPNKNIIKRNQKYFRAPPSPNLIFSTPRKIKASMIITDENKMNVTGINFSPLRYKIYIEI